jgi:pentose-5-phosphate-3-epimerase
MLLIMTVEPGFGGQKFMTDQLPKIAQARKEIGTKAIWLQVDGGISLETIESANGYYSARKGPNSKELVTLLIVARDQRT